ncbi:MAG: exosortase/archaeosortase family protein [Prevotellaceae bacterium]|jgi:exosortase/archaeosortase family protein|nr:exosortase/archaeosortase family protein [Prevotellaceae bacterium]
MNNTQPLEEKEQHEDGFFGKFDHYKGIIYFAVILIVAHFLWKFLITGDESDTMVTLLGIDISAPFRFMVRHIALVCNKVINFFGFGSILRYGNNIWFPDVQTGIRIVWGCTAIKQSYIFICIIAFYRGSWKNKLWYVPAGLIVIYLFNILRICIIAIVTKYYHEWFYFTHEIFLKLVFYFVIFMMWVLWEEKFSKIKKIN